MLENKTLLLINKISYKLDFKPQLLTLKIKKKNLVNKFKLVRQKKKNHA